MTDGRTISQVVRDQDPSALGVIVIVWRPKAIVTSIEFDGLTQDDLYEGLNNLFDVLREEKL